VSDQEAGRIQQAVFWRTVAKIRPIEPDNFLAEHLEPGPFFVDCHDAFS
jgi:hypothetical protein